MVKKKKTLIVEKMRAERELQQHCVTEKSFTIQYHDTILHRSITFTPTFRAHLR